MSRAGSPNWQRVVYGYPIVPQLKHETLSQLIAPTAPKSDYTSIRDHIYSKVPTHDLMGHTVAQDTEIGAMCPNRTRNRRYLSRKSGMYVLLGGGLVSRTLEGFLHERLQTRICDANCCLLDHLYTATRVSDCG